MDGRAGIASAGPFVVCIISCIGPGFGWGFSAPAIGTRMRSKAVRLQGLRWITHAMEKASCSVTSERRGAGMAWREPLGEHLRSEVMKRI